MKFALVVGVLCALSATASAHKPSDAHLKLARQGEQVAGRLVVAVRDLDSALAIDVDGDGAIKWRELVERSPQIAAYVVERLEISGDGVACPLRVGDAALVDLSDGTYWSVPLTARCPQAPDVVAIAYRLMFDIDAQHRGLVDLDGHVSIARDATPMSFELGASSSIVTFVLEGVWHIWIGLDHVLFLFCLLLPAVFLRGDGKLRFATTFRDVAIDVLKVVTAFTVAHSITLVISTLGYVQLPARAVEAAIAMSVVAAALNNLVRVVDARWTVAFVLGLLHGFGFSSVLVDLGLPSHQLVASLLGFNLGVEFGQIALVIVTLPALYLIRRTLAYRILLWAGSAAAAAIGLMWTYQRLVAAG